MMHFQPWNQHQQVLMDQNSCYMSESRAYYSTSGNNQDEEEYDPVADEMPSETSSDQSPRADTFHLAFEAAQWAKLVSNAEGLFTQLMSAYSPNEHNLLKNQIEQWLCLKQEYEECIAVDDSVSLQGFTENTKRSLERIEEVTETDEKTDESNSYCSESEEEEEEEEDQSDNDSDNSDFLDRLSELKKKLENYTDKIVDSRKNDFSPEPKLALNNLTPTVKSKKPAKRKSILPHSDMSDEILRFQSGLEQKIIHCDAGGGLLIEKRDSSKKVDKKAVAKIQNPPLDNEFEILVSEEEEKQSQLKKVQQYLIFAYKKLDKIKKLIQVREEFHQHMEKNFNVRYIAHHNLMKKKSELEKKQSELEENLNEFVEKYNVYKKALKHKGMHREIKDETVAYNKGLKRYEDSLSYYDKKLRDNEIVRKLVSDLEKINKRLQDFLSSSKKQTEDLKLAIKDKEDQKKSLEDELSAIQKRIKELKQKHNLDDVKVKTAEAKNDYSRYIIQYENFVDDAREDRLDHRQQIRILRQTKDQLNDCRYKLEKKKKFLDNKRRNYQTASDKELRQLLIINENIETIDELIEQKNVTICSGGVTKPTETKEPTRSHLGKLSHEELVSLFYKYFYKVVDLKENIDNIETHCDRLETIGELESESNNIKMAHYFGKQINILLDCFNEEYCETEERDMLMKENHHLKKRLAYFESIFHNKSNSVKPLKPDKQLVALQNQRDQTVTLKGNKLIFMSRGNK